VTVTGPSWPARSGLAVTQHAGKLWLFGGRLADDSLTDDLWCSEDGASWTSLDAGHTGAREFATLGSTGASLYVFGGNDAGGASLNDLSVYDGGSWDLDTGPSRWTISRPGFAVWRDAFWFAGGLDGSANSASVWSWYPGPPE
jgi:hypothetical protein